MQRRDVRVAHGAFDLELREAGAGQPALFLHGEAGPRWTRFHDLLAQTRRVIAPSHPGFGRSTGGEGLLDVHDLVYCYLDVLDELGLSGLPLIGHGLGGMFAAELAAVQPDRFTALVLIVPLGLWLPDDPVLDIFAARPAELAAALYHDPGSPAAVAAAATPAEGDALIEFSLERARSMASAARYLWPIPDRGLSKRLHRIAAPTLIVWGHSDGVTSPRYGEAFRQAITGSRLVVLQEAGHLPHEEQPDRLATLTLDFLAHTPSSPG